MNYAKNSEHTTHINEFINYLMIHHLEDIYDHDVDYVSLLKKDKEGDENYDNMYSQDVDQSIFL